jgi:hypothetical protein
MMPVGLGLLHPVLITCKTKQNVSYQTLGNLSGNFNKCFLTAKLANMNLITFKLQAGGQSCHLIFYQRRLPGTNPVKEAH